VSENYIKLPLEELLITTSEAADANFDVIVGDDYSHRDYAQNLEFEITKRKKELAENAR
jgi:hypothetical protein